MKSYTHKISLAPMMDYTDRHFRYLLRLISKHILLFTEMIPVNTLLYNDFERFLNYHETEHPIALQLGGSEPALLQKAAKYAEQFNYDEINLNIGCPSNKVKKGRFGACLMAEPQLVAECVDAMSSTVDIPITIKTRIGIDNRDSYADLLQFIDCVARAGCNTFYIHARKAWLTGLNPKQNRHIPPLDYQRVYRLKKDFPQLNIIINGGITNKR